MTSYSRPGSNVALFRLVFETLVFISVSSLWRWRFGRFWWPYERYGTWVDFQHAVSYSVSC